MQRIAIIDVGSNSARLVILHVFKSKAYNMVYDQKETLRLSQKVTKKGRLTPAAFNDTLECMRSFAAMCKLYNTDKTIAVATAAIRNASNGQELIELVRKETGIDISIISGEVESHLSYIGVVNTIDVKDGIIFDLGGGSTELVLVKNRRMVSSVSLPIGAVNLTAQFKTRDKITPALYARLRKAIAAQLAKAPWLKACGLPLIGVGGTARALAKLHQKKNKYFSAKIHNYQMTSAETKNTIKAILPTSLTERRRIPGLNLDRADIIISGLAIIKAITDSSHTKNVIISGAGLRDGLFMEYYSRQYNTPLIVPDILKASTMMTQTLYSPDPKHAQHVTSMALRIFDAWKGLHKLDEDWRTLLETAASLHDIGITINFYSHHRHSAYMIDNAKIFGLTHKELLMASIIAGWHNGVSKGLIKNPANKNLLTFTDLKRISKAAVILALAESLDYSQTGTVQDITPTYSKKNAFIHIKSDTVPTVEIHQLKKYAPWFKKVFAHNLEVKTKS